MSLYRAEAVVLRTQKLGEADRIVTVLSHRHGRIRAVVKGVRRTTSKFGARLEPFSHVDLQLAEGRSLHVVTQAESLPTLSSSSGQPLGSVIGSDYRAYTAGTAMLEAADRLAGEDLEPAVQQYLLLVGGLRVLAGGEREPSLVLDAFLLRSLAVAGYAPSFDVCARCGAAGPHRWFSAPVGGMVCPSCRQPGSSSPSAATVLLLSALLTGDWATAAASDERARKQGAGLVAAYLQWHLERGLRSLTHVDR